MLLLHYYIVLKSKKLAEINHIDTTLFSNNYSIYKNVTFLTVISTLCLLPK